MYLPPCATGLPEDAEAHLAVAVEVRVEAHGVVAGGDELDAGRVDGVVGGAAEQEEKETPLVRGVEGPRDQSVDLGGGGGGGRRGRNVIACDVTSIFTLAHATDQKTHRSERHRGGGAR